ncbi:MAG: hypothetical protein R2867_44670 [Caldilineaceae bacterium]
MSLLEWASFTVNITIMIAFLCHTVISQSFKRTIRLFSLFSLSTIALYLIILLGISAVT